MWCACLLQVHLEQSREAKRQDLEQRARDEEIAGGRAIIKRTKKKHVRERGPSLHTDGASLCLWLRCWFFYGGMCLGVSV